MQVKERGVRTALYWVGTAILAFNFPVSAIRAVANPRAYTIGFAAAVLASIGGLLVWAAIRNARRRDPHPQVTALVAVACVALLLHPWFAGTSPVPYPPLFHVLGAAMCVSALISVRTSMAVIPAFSAVVAWQRSAELGVTRAVTEALLLALSGAIGAACVYVLEQADRSVQTAVAATRRLEEESHRARRQAYEREHWNALVHDKVLGAFHLTTRAAARRIPEAAKALAEEAKAALHGRGGAWASPVEAWKQHASRLGLSLTTDCPGRLNDPEVEETVVAAGMEALTNVARHSGQSTVTIVGSLEDNAALVRVADPGRGFDTDALQQRAGGLSGISGRMRAAGGTVEISSSPGEGTTVTLAWQPVPRGPQPAHWQLRTFAPMMILGALALVLNVTVSAQQWLHSRSVAVAAVGIAVIVGATVAVSLFRPTMSRAVVVATVMVGVTIAHAANTDEHAGEDWRYWYLGAMTPALGAFTYRFSTRTGLLTGAAMIVSVMAVDAVVRQAPFAGLGGAVPVLIATAVAAHLLRRALDGSWQRVQQATAADSEFRLAIAAEEERAREARLRVNALAGSVTPALDLITSRTDLTDEDLRRLIVLEASVRDHLAAPALLDASLVQALLEARTRGARVEVVMVRNAGTEPDDPQEHSGFRTALCGVLSLVPKRARVRATWRPGTELSGSAISVVAPNLADVFDRLAVAYLDQPADRRPAVTQDEDSLLIEFGRRTR